MAGSYEVVKGPAELGNEEAVAGVESAASVAEAARQAALAAAAADSASTAATTASGAAAIASAQVSTVTAAATAAVGTVNSTATTAVATVNAATSTATDAATTASGAASDADASQQLAAAWAEGDPGSGASAKDWASLDPTAFVDPVNNLKSARGYASDAAGLIGMTLLQPVLYVPDWSAAPRSGLLTAADFGWLLVGTQTGAQTLTLPANLNQQLWQGDTPSAAWVRVVNAGTANLTIAAAGGGAAPNPATIAENRLPAEVFNAPTPTGDTVRTFSLAVPAGTGRYLHVSTSSMYDAADASRNTRVVAAVHGGSALVVTKVSGDLATDTYNGSGAVLDGSGHVAPIPDGGAVTIDVTVTYSKNLICHSARVSAVGNAGGYSGQVGFSDSSAADALVSVGFTVPSGGALFRGAFHQRKAASSPATITAGVTVDASGTTPATTPADGTKRIVFAYAEKFYATAGSQTVAATFAAAEKGMGLGLLFTPAAGGGSVTIVHTRSLTVAAGDAVTIDVLSDGLTYVVT